MKVATLPEKLILDTYKRYWDGYLHGDVESMAALLADDYTEVGSAEDEIFRNKKDAVEFLHKTVERLLGKTQVRNRITILEPIGFMALIHDQFDVYALSGEDWIYYSTLRATSIMKETPEGWKILHKHSSFPDTRTGDNENIAIYRVAEENTQLREAVKRRTAELEQTNRELEIEAALERIRASAMAMQSSSELYNVVNVMREQMGRLGQPELEIAAVHLYPEGSDTFETWYASRVGEDATVDIVTGSTVFKRDSCQLVKEMMAAYESNQTDYTIEANGEKLEEWIEVLSNAAPSLTRQVEHSMDRLFHKNAERWDHQTVSYYHFSKFSGGALVMISFQPPTEESKNLQHRAAAVFDLAYRRYVEIKLAEAQAKEAKIETSLERVRSRSLEMRDSSELQDVVKVAFENLLSLGIENINALNINIFRKGSKDFDLWLAAPGQNYTTNFHIPYIDHPIPNDFFETINNGKNIHAHVYDYDVKNEYFKYMFENSDDKFLPEDRKQLILKGKAYGITAAIARHSAIFANNYSGELLNEEDSKILVGFSKVFDQAYTRYLDLQRAEANAREAQIEGALERVRSRTMGMQKSDELRDVIQIVFEQLRHLDFKIDSAHFNLNYKQSDDYDLWTAAPGQPYPVKTYIPYFDHPVFITARHAKEQGLDFFTESYTQEEKNEFFGHLFKNAPHIPEERKKYILSGKGVAASTVIMNNISLWIINYAREPYSHEENAILRRFGKIFEQSHTRFLDLKKAEAQTREAKIEAALEKIRSVSLGMHHSGEIQDVVAVLFEKLKELDVVFDGGAAIHLFTEGSKNAIIWVASPDLRQPSCVNLPYDEEAFKNNPIILDVWHAKESGQHIYNKFYSCEEKNKYFDYVFKHNDLTTIPKLSREFILTADSYTATFIAEKNSLLGANSWTGQRFSEHNLEVLKRISRVFEQAYTRYLDLQKAEAQAREAQIQLALERVRARTMSMHHSDELLKVIREVIEQFRQLGFNIDTANFNTNYRNKDWDLWIDTGGTAALAQVHIPYFDHPIFNDIIAAIDAGADSFSGTLDRNEKHIFLKYLFENTVFKNNPEDRKQSALATPGFSYSVAFAKTTSVTIGNYNAVPYSQEQNDILKRLANVFEQSYTRFLDLKKAEEQAREAQIELGLERVRARAMAMQNSGELADLVEIVFNELKKLDLLLDRCLIMIYDPETKGSTWWLADPNPGAELAGVFVKYHQSPPYLAYLDAWQNRTLKWKYLLDGKDKREWDDFIFSETDMAQLPEAVIAGMRSVERIFLNASFNNFGSLTASSFEALPEEQFDILLRFAKVFDSTYTRFLDLQKAEAQAREAEIQLALERVRARTMAMQQSDELAEVSSVLFQQMKSLGVDSYSSGFTIWDEQNNNLISWMCNADGSMNPPFIMPIAGDAWHIRQFESWKNGEEFIVKDFAGEEMESYFAYLRSFPLLDEAFKRSIAAGHPMPDRQVHNVVNFSHGNLLFITLEPCPKAHDILKRFAKVFQQTYTRFLDLQKAEAQAKEAKIEASLDRVRAKAMAMRNSGELDEVLAVLFDQFDILGIESVSTHITLINPETNTFTFRETGKGGHQSFGEQTVAIDSMDIWKEAANKWKASTPLSINRLHFPKESLPQVWQVFHESFASMPEGAKIYPEDYPDGIYHTAGNCKFGYIGMNQTKKATEEEEEIVLKFATEFGRLYQRFLDLQKAEAQAREATIETALEKVRSMAMAMHNSEDVNATIAVFYRQLDLLGLKPRGCGVGLMHRHERTAEISTMNATETGEAVAVTGTIKMVGHPLLEGIYDGWLNQKEYHTVLRGKAIKDYYKILKPQISFPNYHGDEAQYGHFFTFKEGGVYAWTEKELKEDELNIYRRFTSVLSLTYRRYKDLKEAEFQAREAIVEAALERVRAKAMSMQSSQNLAETINVFYHEMSLLKITPRRCGVGLLDKETQMAELSTMNTTQQGSSVEILGKLKMEGHPVLENIFSNWLMQHEYHPVLRGNEIKEYYKLIRPQIDFPDYPEDEVQYGYFFFFPSGGVYAWTNKELAEDELKIYRKFTTVLSLTYKRYKELKEAEERTQIAIRQSSLDRIRAEIASMRTTDDLQRITPSVWKELITLGVPFFRCGVFIINEKEEKVHSYLSTPDGKPLGVLHLDFTSSSTTANLVESWRHRQVYKEHWSREEFLTWIDSMIGQGQSITVSTYQAGNTPPESLTLQFVPFTQGMIYVGTAEVLNDVHIDLVQSLADAFSTAYARYEDFNKLELAKQQVDNTLKELRSAQQQLIQSEKMASLGELTAGIAHEIQNPLNFINNFSDVNKELIEELEQAAIKGNLEEVKALSGDLRDNEQKINHHGKRADAIVKGMLQHSRTNTGQKELVDINALADEYLRLSYHGCRAKDKAFNTSFTTNFDETIKKVAVVPQEIGRVFLNIFNNAFYAVSERKKLEPKEYEPRVSVTTQKVGNQVVITINDNGTGIPQKVLDKVFQPFFTTKPTGQGTGLGLSLSYDIVLSHGGELKVKTKEGEGSEFIIELPNDAH